MIILVHSLYFVIKFLRNAYTQQRVINEFRRHNDERIREEEVYNNAIADIEEISSLTFDPPVYRQRYSVVQQELLERQSIKDIKKVVEFGCNKLAFFPYLKNLYGIEEVLEIDIDEEILQENIYAVLPKDIDYLKGGSKPFNVHVLCGDLGDPDFRLANADAVIAIEVIEHLYPDTLDALSYNIFGYINPQIVIITTPNSDFNILFQNFRGFRHYDHKFEWSREQFRDWAVNQTLRFPEYSVKIKGIGEGPRGTECLGCCSQMAVFTKNYETISSEIALVAGEPREVMKSHGVCTYYSFSNQFGIIKCEKNLTNSFYKLVNSIEYPFNKNLQNTRQIILEEAMSLLYRNVSVYSRYYNDKTQCVEVPLYELLANERGGFSTVHQLKNIFEDAQFLVKECCPARFDESILCVVYDVNVDSGHSEGFSEDEESADGDQNRETLNLYTSFESETDCEAENDYITTNVREAQTIVSKLLNQATSVTSSEENLKLYDHFFDSSYQEGISPRNGVLDMVSEDDSCVDEVCSENIFEDDSEVMSINEDYDLDDNSDGKDSEEIVEDEEEGNQDGTIELVYEEAGDASHTEEFEIGVNQASLEGLFDPNSQRDLLSEFPVIENVNLEVEESQGTLPIIVEDNAEPENDDIIPNWLLATFNNQSYEEFFQESHCKGDGIGVHGAYIHLVDDSSTSSSSTSGSHDEAQAENVMTEDDVSLLPEDISFMHNPHVPEIILPGHDLHPSVSRISNESNDEFYDTLESNSENCATNK